MRLLVLVLVSPFIFFFVSVHDVCQIKLITLSFLVHVKLFHRIRIVYKFTLYSVTYLLNKLLNGKPNIAYYLDLVYLGKLVSAFTRGPFTILLIQAEFCDRILHTRASATATGLYDTSKHDQEELSASSSVTPLIYGYIIPTGIHTAKRGLFVAATRIHKNS